MRRRSYQPDRTPVHLYVPALDRTACAHGYGERSTDLLRDVTCRACRDNPSGLMRPIVERDGRLVLGESYDPFRKSVDHP